MCYGYPKTLPERSEGGYKIGLNTRVMDPAELATVNREINYEALFEPLDPKDAAHPEDLAKYCS